MRRAFSGVLIFLAFGAALAGCGSQGAPDVPGTDLVTADAVADAAPLDEGQSDAVEGPVDTDEGPVDTDEELAEDLPVPDLPPPPDVAENPVCTNPDAMVIVSGQVVQAIGGEWHPMDGGVVSVVGRPDLSIELGPTEYAYEIMAPSCSDIVLKLEHPELHTVHSGLIYTGDAGIDGVTLQTPDHGTFDLLMFMSGVTMDTEMCQMATTVTDAAHLTDIPCDYCGEPGVKVALDPPVTVEHGPIYFEIGGVSIIYPVPELTETSEDGGVLFVNLPAGDYVVYGYRDGLEMTYARFHCESGWFVNPAPPRGIQVQPVSE